MSLEFAIIAVGSTGDVRPLVALAIGLQNAGNRVRLITHESFRSLVDDSNLTFFPIVGDYRSFLQSPDGLRLVNNKQLPWKRPPRLHQELPKQLRKALEAAKGSDAIVVGPLSTWGYHIAEKLDIPLIVASYLPVQTTKYFPFLQFGIKSIKSVNPIEGGLNKFSYALGSTFAWISYRDVVNDFRQSINLEKLPFLGPRFRGQQPGSLKRILILHLYSEAVLPSPPDWETETHPAYTTGYCFMEARHYQPPQPLVDFIEQQSDLPMISIGFGSMPVNDSDQMLELISQAIQQAQVRAVLISGWGLEKGNLNNPNIYQIESVPHDWLFPKMSAVIHHSGSGTTSAGLRAGVPAVTVPFFGDQPAWAKRLANLGIAPKPIPAKSLTAELLAKAIREAVSDQTMVNKAQKIAQIIDHEDGVGKAVTLIEHHLSNF
ncbi:MAG: glycosyltransferase [Cyanobacteria bacterium P01_G01_bin.38]